MVRWVLFSCCVLLLAAPLAAQAPSAASTGFPTLARGFSDAGVFRIRRDGKEVGQEKFNIRWEGNLLKADADIDLKVAQSPPAKMHTELVLDASGKMVSYRAVRSGAGPQKEIAVTLEKQVAICEEKGGNLSESTPVLVDPGFVLLDTNVFHHFEFLAARLLGDKHPEEIPALIPQEQVSGKMKIQAVGRETLKDGKQKVLVSHFQLDSGQVKISIWFDDAGRLYKISVPQTKAEVTRVSP
jgi:hypothetical protein